MPVLVAFGSFVATLLGGVAALRIGDRSHLVLGLAAGLMLAVVLFDLVPEALGQQPEHWFGLPAAMLATMAGVPAAGAAISWAIRIPRPVVGLYLGLFAGIVLYLATSDILPEAHASHPSRLTLACTIVGAGFMWLVIGLAS